MTHDILYTCTAASEQQNKSDGKDMIRWQVIHFMQNAFFPCLWPMPHFCIKVGTALRLSYLKKKNFSHIVNIMRPNG